VAHPTYKHLEDRLRLGAFTLGQWAQIASAVTLAAVFGIYVSPLPATATIFVSIVGAGLPVAVAYGALGLDFSVGQLAVSAWRYWRAPRHYLPGPGRSAVGYVVERPPARETSDPKSPAAAGGRAGERGALWDL
jgi:hypothetical protein